MVCYNIYQIAILKPVLPVFKQNFRFFVKNVDFKVLLKTKIKNCSLKTKDPGFKIAIIN